MYKTFIFVQSWTYAKTTLAHHFITCSLQSAAGWAGGPSGCVAFPHTSQPQSCPWIQEGHQEAHGLLHHQREAHQQPVCLCQCWFINKMDVCFTCGIKTFSTNYRYSDLETFIVDVNLVFENCERFNEDDSEIGRAGHSMRSFFDKRWAELLK